MRGGRDRRGRRRAVPVGLAPFGGALPLTSLWRQHEMLQLQEKKTDSSTGHAGGEPRTIGR